MFRCASAPFRPRSGSAIPFRRTLRFPADEGALTCARTRVCAPAPQQLFVFCLHRFTHLAQTADRLHNKGEDFLRKLGRFRAKSGNHRPITPLFSTDLPSPRRKTHSHAFSRRRNWGTSTLRTGIRREHERSHPYSTVIQLLNHRKRLSNPPRCAAIFLGFCIGLFAASRCAKHDSGGKQGV